MLCALARNSAFALEQAITDCFLLHLVTRLPPTNVQYSDVDLLSVIEPAQSASEEASISKCPLLVYNNPLSGSFLGIQVPYK